MATLVQGEWKIFSDDQAPNGRASVPRPWRNEAGRGALFVRLKRAASDVSIALPTQDRKGAEGNRIWVKPGTLGLASNENDDCTIEVLSDREFRKHRLFNSRSGKLALAGSAIAIIGTLIEASLKVGAAMTTPWIHISEEIHVVLLWGASCLQIIGLALVFVLTVILADA